MASPTQPATILIVEDNRELTALLLRVLCEHGYTVHSAADGDAALTCAAEISPDLMILDVGLPRMNGFEVVHELRRRGVNIPTMMLTARDGVADRVAGLDAGADDYLTKPFDTDELVARVRALLRRAAVPPRVNRLRVGDLRLDPLTKEVFRGDEAIMLTQREFALLEFFMRNPGRPITRPEIARSVWSHDTPTAQEETNIVDVYVNYLRRKLDLGGPPILFTVRGTGYMLKAD